MCLVSIADALAINDDDLIPVGTASAVGPPCLQTALLPEHAYGQLRQPAMGNRRRYGARPSTTLTWMCTASIASGTAAAYHRIASVRALRSRSCGQGACQQRNATVVVTAPALRALRDVVHPRVVREVAAERPGAVPGVVQQRHAVALRADAGFDGKADAAAEAVVVEAARVDGGGEGIAGGVDEEVGGVYVSGHLVEAAGLVGGDNGVDLPHLPRRRVAHCMTTAYSTEVFLVAVVSKCTGVCGMHRLRTLSDPK